ncbi:DUF624 domain-containing protein [Streptococcus suis]|uniref:DUF624 domain-containing protein n=1 Tax=Streptococcus suis TaxID=1307 RepID=UPI00211CF077|nr:DUF624 domain-containing protein [Streptococcus suis]MCQ9276620.1 DUF624 domain-containing protein [Streptococcus suis]
MLGWLDRLFTLLFFLMKLSAIYLVLLLLGGVVLGISPANGTILYLYDNYHMDASKYNFREAFGYFKEHFIRLNLGLGLVLLLIGLLFSGIWLLIQLPQTWWMPAVLITNAFGLFYIFALYALFLKLQVHFEFSLKTGLQLAAVSFFLDWKALVKFLLGSLVCGFLLFKLPLILFFFLPVLWLLFLYDAFDPVYKKVDKDYL